MRGSFPSRSFLNCAFFLWPGDACSFVPEREMALARAIGGGGCCAATDEIRQLVGGGGSTVCVWFGCCSGKKRKEIGGGTVAVVGPLCSP